MVDCVLGLVICLNLMHAPIVAAAAAFAVELELKCRTFGQMTAVATVAAGIETRTATATVARSCWIP